LPVNQGGGTIAYLINPEIWWILKDKEALWNL
jgi:hypothetical protein